jgi:phage minor structural protein
MLTLFHNNQQIVLDTTEYYVRELASGLDEVIFEISIWDPNYALMNEEENIVDRGGQRYLIKQIDAGAVTAKIVCQLDLDEWKASMLVGYNSGTKTVAQQISAVLPSGWSVFDYSYSSIGRTIKGDLTPLQVCEQCRSTYQVYVRWDNKDKRVYIYPQALGTPVGSFATRELNLKEINYKGKSNNFATRLYAYGKDGLSFADINSGKPYVDNNTYSDRVICAYWQDDRYTDKTSLLNDAIEHLAKLAVPERSYDCAIVDLQATNPELYNNLDFSLFTTATLIDDVKNVAVDYLVIERHVWPYHPDRNDVIFNSAPVKIQNAVIQIEDELTNPNSTFQQILQAEIDLVTDWLTDNESHCYITQNDDGTIKDFIFVNGDQPIQTATQVMRINASGLGFSKNGVNGPFTNAFVFDSVKGGHLIADFITAGHMVADRIQGGTLESINGTTIGGVTYKNFSLDMTTGAIEALAFTLKTPNLTLNPAGQLASLSGNYRTVLENGSIKFYYGNTLATELIGAAMGNYSIMEIKGSTAGSAIVDIDGRLDTDIFNMSARGVSIQAGLNNNQIEMSANERISLSASLQLILAGETIGIGSSGNTDEIDLYGSQINFQGAVTINSGINFAYGGIEVGGTSAWSGIINGVSDGNGHYGDITVNNGIITGWSDWS